MLLLYLIARRRFGADGADSAPNFDDDFNPMNNDDDQMQWGNDEDDVMMPGGDDTFGDVSADFENVATVGKSSMGGESFSLKVRERMATATHIPHHIHY